MANKTRSELIHALRDIELVSEDFRSAFALMYAYLTGPDDCMDDALAEAFENAHAAIMFRASVKDVSVKDIRARTLH
jgi:hypothetical protein